MSSSKPVVVYGASGFTGRLVCEYFREYNLPFVAAGRSGDRVQSAMDHNVPGIETAGYEVVAVDHTVDALTELFTGASVVCNTVGQRLSGAPPSARPATTSPDDAATARPPAKRSAASSATSSAASGDCSSRSSRTRTASHPHSIS